MRSFADRTASAVSVEFLARFASDPPALEVIRAAGRLLAEQTAHRCSPASVDVSSCLRLQLAAAGAADLAEHLPQLGDFAFVDDLVAL